MILILVEFSAVDASLETGSCTRDGQHNCNEGRRADASHRSLRRVAHCRGWFAFRIRNQSKFESKLRTVFSVFPNFLFWERVFSTVLFPTSRQVFRRVWWTSCRDTDRRLGQAISEHPDIAKVTICTKLLISSLVFGTSFSSVIALHYDAISSHVTNRNQIEIILNTVKSAYSGTCLHTQKVQLMANCHYSRTWLY